MSLVLFSKYIFLALSESEFDENSSTIENDNVVDESLVETMDDTFYVQVIELSNNLINIIY